eukprot:TRINITY_DN89518_c0_g1_i1.p1 TRINITY_DN89518_c0_g1~~TRINITY_DN89518_c0_g1_i1.p1  ORF type:complete len:164 (-),score=33.36 TRINITY_DN89518_c0_g1_i1:159-650(-)
MTLDDDSTQTGRRKANKSRSPKRKQTSDDQSLEDHKKDKGKALQSKEEQRQQEEVERERAKLAEDAKRMNRTVMLVGLSVRADERDVFEFFSGRAGTVRDVQIIRDARTGRSKGVAYVEFGTSEGTVKALGMSGQTVKGAKVIVQQAQIEERGANRASQSGYR